MNAQRSSSILSFTLNHFVLSIIIYTILSGKTIESVKVLAQYRERRFAVPRELLWEPCCGAQPRESGLLRGKMTCVVTTATGSLASSSKVNALQYNSC
jgi:hypothetical protein